MRRRDRAAIFASVLLVLSLIGSPALAQGEQPVQQRTEIVFPGDARFPELESKLQEKVNISASAWPDEFKKRQAFGQVRSNTGLTGALFNESVALIALLAGQVPYIIYGTINIPQGSKLGEREFSGNYGIVVIANPLVAALIDTTTWTIGAFILLPVQTGQQMIPLFPIFPLVPFIGPLGIFQILFTLITVPTPTPQAPPTPVTPQPPQLPVPTCPQDLPNKSDVNTPLNESRTISTIKDDAGADLFTIGVSPPGILTVQSFAQSLQISYSTTYQRRLGFIIGPGVQQYPLSLELPLALFVTNGKKAACLQATPKLVNGVATIIGTLSTN